jgi:hypothetical protein
LFFGKDQGYSAAESDGVARWVTMFQHRDILFLSALPTNTAQILALPRLHQSFFALNFEKPNNQ